MPNDGRGLDLDPPQPPALSDHPPQRLIHDIPFPDSHQPPIEFWENRLESPARRLFEDAADPRFIGVWIRQRTTRQVAMLCRLFGLPVEEPARQKRARLKELHGQLIEFVPAADFAMRKSAYATLDVAAECLDTVEIAVARESNGKYDTTALIFAILHRSWMDLEKLFHLDKLHKVGFARMRLAKPPRRPQRKLREFLASDELRALLKQFDTEQRDRHTSELLQVIELRDSHLVFIRRPHQKTHLLADERVVHGFTADQIVLDFRDEGTRLNVASHGHAASYDIANRIASAYYGQTVEYENITEESHEALISRFLQLLRNDQARDLRLVEIRVQSGPLHGAPDIGLSNKDDLSIGPALGQLEQALSWTINDISRVPKLKVLFNDKRVGMEIEPLGNGLAEVRTYVLRYRDQSLTLAERQMFEELLEQDHGIKIVSTEKRGARGR